MSHIPLDRAFCVMASGWLAGDAAFGMLVALGLVLAELALTVLPSDLHGRMRSLWTVCSLVAAHSMKRLLATCSVEGAQVDL